MRPPTRGERNCNPGNLRSEGIPWEGLADPPKDDGGYCIFTAAEHGLRALARDAYVKWWFDGLDTVAKIIAKYAPPSENNTAAYINDVCDRMGVTPDAKLDLNDPAQLHVLAHAIVLHENGRCIYSDATLAAAVQQALGKTGAS